MAKKATEEPEPPPHRGRIQAQGGDTEESEAWAGDSPPTKAEVLEMLEHVWARLSANEQQERENCREEARRYIERAPATGIVAPFSKSFRNRKKREGVRIDLEVRAGTACIDP